MTVRLHADQVDSDAPMVRRLLAAQFPEWADLPVERVASDGTDNAVYRLGEELVARLPLIEWAVGQVEKEHTWLPRLAPLLPLALHEPMAVGEPGEGYPWNWSVYRWLEGENARPDRIGDINQAAVDVAEFINALHAVEVEHPPRSQRGMPLSTMDAEIRDAIVRVGHEFDADALTEIWADAVAAPRWAGPWVLVHGDLTDGNVLVRDGRVHAVIDFSCFGTGEPANDLDITWDLFDGGSRAVFREALALDDDTWRRARGWAVRAVYGISYYRDTNPGIVARARRRINAVLAEVGTGAGATG